MNDWYKKGELPPKDTHVLARWLIDEYENKSEWKEVKHIFSIAGESWLYVDGKSEVIPYAEFKPLKSKQELEREAFVQEFITPLVYSDDAPLNRDSTWEEIAEVLFDAGYRKVKPLSFAAFNQMYRQCDRSENLYHMIKSHIVSEG